MSKAAAAAQADFDADSEVDGPVSSFQSYAAEGDILAKQGDYKKAIDAYSKALTLRPTDKNCLVSRSKCFLQLGDSQAALADADASLKEDTDFFKGKFQKAEALYAMGDFEMALVYYHRGNKLRPELDEFRLGIQKAREAIDNSIGNPRDYKLHSPGSWNANTADKAGGVGNIPGGAPGLPATSLKAGAIQSSDKRGNGQRYSGPSGSNSDAGGRPSTMAKNRTPTTGGPGNGGMASGGNGASVGASGNNNGNSAAATISSSSSNGPTSEKTVKQLLGELYADKEYLQRLYDDREFVSNPNDNIYALVSDGLKYLDTRTEFWRQQKPMYARKKEHSRIQAKVNHARNRQAATHVRKSVVG